MSQVGSERPGSPEPAQQQGSAAPAGSVAGQGSTRSESAKTKNDSFYEAWDKFYTPRPPPNKAVTPSLDTDVENHPGHPTRRNTMGLVSCENASVSFEEASNSCRKKVEAIVAECRRLNIKYSDPLFRIGAYDTLASLAAGDNPDSVDDNCEFKGSVKRIEDIFDDPKFIVDGATVNDIRQGATGNCWFLAAVTALSGTEEPGEPLRLVDRLCVARDEKVGVYGFVFHRDGEWISEVVDDKLCITESVESIEKMPKKIKSIYAKGSDALYFASCRDSNETWLPLLEKAYAKAHGDYQSIDAGLSGEGIEDLTGGVSTSLATEDVLDRDVLWSELQRVNRDFLFGCSSRRGLDSNPADTEGFVRGHAYTVLEAREVDGHRLLKIRNPWGEQEWKGAWSDGSKEWTPERLKEAKHTFGDDGIFWISFKDFPTYYPRLDRTRLFGPEWTVTQQWTTVDVPYNAEYLDTKFALDVAVEGPLVIVLAVPDDRYFRGLDGRYAIDLHFRLYRDGEETYLLRSMNESGLGRSCSAEFDAKPGSYHILMKITAYRYDSVRTAEEAIKYYRRNRRDKLIAVGRSFDSIHSKGRLREAEKARVEQAKKKTKSETKQRRVELMKRERLYDREVGRKERLRIARIDAETERKKAIKRAEKEADAASEGTAEPETEEEKQDVVTNNAEAAEPTQNGETTTNEGGADEVKEAKGEVENLKSSKSTDSLEVLIENTEGKTDSKNDDAHEEVKEDEEAPKTNGEEQPESLPNGESKTSTEEADQKNEQGQAEPETNSAAKEDDSARKEDGHDEGEGEGEGEDGEDTISEVSAVHDFDFDWDSDIDSPPDPIEMVVTPDSDDDMFSEDPWNALQVVGLRVYSKGSGGVNVRVVKIGAEDEEEKSALDAEKEKGRGEVTAKQADGGNCGPPGKGVKSKFKPKGKRGRATG